MAELRNIVRKKTEADVVPDVIFFLDLPEKIFSLRARLNEDWKKSN